MSGKPYSNALIHHTIYKVKEHWQQVRSTLDPDASTAAIREKWLLQIPYFKQLSFHHSLAIVLWDIIDNRFLFAVDERNLTGYDTSLYTNEDGVDFSLRNFHPDYIYAMRLMDQCNGKLLAEYRHVPHDKIISNYDALYRIKDGTYIHILQQIVPVEVDSNGQPFLYLSYIRDITHLKKQPSASFIFSTPTESKYWKYNFEDKELELVVPFTTQEKKILAYLSEGKQTRFIAEELSISTHTVHTHYRRMLAKTNCVDTTALIAYSQMVGLL